MTRRSLHLLALFVMAAMAAAGPATAQDCTGTITADEAMKAEIVALRRADQQ